MKILIPLFSPATGTWGGLTRVLAVARAARQAGHEAAFCASGSLESTLKGHGFQVYSMPRPTFLGLPRFISDWIQARSQQATPPVKPGRDFGSIWLVLLISGMAKTGYLRQAVAAQLRAAQDFGARAVFTDLDPAAFLLAHLTGLPVASTYQSVMRQGVGTFPWRVMNDAAAAVLRDYKKPYQPVDQLMLGSRVMKIIPSIPELDGENPNRPDVCYVGPLLGEIQANADDFTPEPGKRYIFVYTGAGSIQLDQVRKTLARALPEAGPLRAVIGAQSMTRPERFGAVEARPYVSARALLPHCDWTLCHGGQNTIVQSLQHGVPLLVFPGPIFERRFNARRVQAAGAGLMGELNEFSVDWLRAAFEKQADCARSAARLAARMEEFGGARAALQAIEKWAEA